MVSQIAEEKNRYSTTVKNAVEEVFIDRIDELWLDKIKMTLQNYVKQLTIDSEREFVNDLIGINEYLSREVVFYLNGERNVKLAFIKRLESIFAELFHSSIIDSVNDRVVNRYYKMAVDELHNHLLQNIDLYELISNLTGNFFSDKSLYTKGVDMNEKFLNKAYKDNLKMIVENTIKHQNSYLERYCGEITNKYCNTIYHFFADYKFTNLGSQISNELAIKAIEKTIDEFKNVPGLDVNSFEISKLFAGINTRIEESINYSPDEYMKEYESPYIIEPKDPDEIDAQEKKFIYEFAINSGDTGFQYENIFGSCFEGTKNILIEDTYVREEHQIQNLIRFCSVAKKHADIFKIILVTRFFSDNRKEIDKKLEILKENLKSHKTIFEFYYRKNLHDRNIYFDNGYKFFLGSGLDIYDYYKLHSLENSDFSLRKCKETSIQVFFNPCLFQNKLAFYMRTLKTDSHS